MHYKFEEGGKPMSNMTTLSKVMERVDNMSRNHDDQFIGVKDISFEDLKTIRIGDESHRLRPVAQQSIANRLGIPIQYLRKCPEDIQALNMNPVSYTHLTLPTNREV